MGKTPLKQEEPKLVEKMVSSLARVLFIGRLKKDPVSDNSDDQKALEAISEEVRTTLGADRLSRIASAKRLVGEQGLYEILLSMMEELRQDYEFPRGLSVDAYPQPDLSFDENESIPQKQMLQFFIELLTRGEQWSFQIENLESIRKMVTPAEFSRAAGTLEVLKALRTERNQFLDLFSTGDGKGVEDPVLREQSVFLSYLGTEETSSVREFNISNDVFDVSVSGDLKNLDPESPKNASLWNSLRHVPHALAFLNHYVSYYQVRFPDGSLPMDISVVLAPLAGDEAIQLRDQTILIDPSKIKLNDAETVSMMDAVIDARHVAEYTSLEEKTRQEEEVARAKIERLNRKQGTFRPTSIGKSMFGFVLLGPVVLPFITVGFLLRPLFSGLEKLFIRWRIRSLEERIQRNARALREAKMRGRTETPDPDSQSDVVIPKLNQLAVEAVAGKNVRPEVLKLRIGAVQVSEERSRFEADPELYVLKAIGENLLPIRKDSGKDLEALEIAIRSINLNSAYTELKEERGRLIRQGRGDGKDKENLAEISKIEAAMESITGEIKKNNEAMVGRKEAVEGLLNQAFAARKIYELFFYGSGFNAWVRKKKDFFNVALMFAGFFLYAVGAQGMEFIRGGSGTGGIASSGRGSTPLSDIDIAALDSPVWDGVGAALSGFGEVLEALSQPLLKAQDAVPPAPIFQDSYAVWAGEMDALSSIINEIYNPVADRYKAMTDLYALLRPDMTQAQLDDLSFRMNQLSPTNPKEFNETGTRLIEAGRAIAFSKLGATTQAEPPAAVSTSSDVDASDVEPTPEEIPMKGEALPGEFLLSIDDALPEIFSMPDLVETVDETAEIGALPEAEPSVSLTPKQLEARGDLDRELGARFSGFKKLLKERAKATAGEVPALDQQIDTYRNVILYGLLNAEETINPVHIRTFIFNNNIFTLNSAHKSPEGLVKYFGDLRVNSKYREKIDALVTASGIERDLLSETWNQMKGPTPEPAPVETITTGAPLADAVQRELTQINATLDEMRTTVDMPPEDRAAKVREIRERLNKISSESFGLSGGGEIARFFAGVSERVAEEEWALRPAEPVLPGQPDAGQNVADTIGAVVASGAAAGVGAVAADITGAGVTASVLDTSSDGGTTPVDAATKVAVGGLVSAGEVMYEDLKEGITDPTVQLVLGNKLEKSPMLTTTEEMLFSETAQLPSLLAASEEALKTQEYSDQYRKWTAFVNAGVNAVLTRHYEKTRYQGTAEEAYPEDPAIVKLVPYTRTSSTARYDSWNVFAGAGIRTGSDVVKSDEVLKAEAALAQSNYQIAVAQAIQQKLFHMTEIATLNERLNRLDASKKTYLDKIQELQTSLGESHASLPALKRQLQASLKNFEIASLNILASRDWHKTRLAFLMGRDPMFANNDKGYARYVETLTYDTIRDAALTDKRTDDGIRIIVEQAQNYILRRSAELDKVLPGLSWQLTAPEALVSLGDESDWTARVNLFTFDLAWSFKNYMHNQWVRANTEAAKASVMGRMVDIQHDAIKRLYELRSLKAYLKQIEKQSETELLVVEALLTSETQKFVRDMDPIAAADKYILLLDQIESAKGELVKLEKAETELTQQLEGIKKEMTGLVQENPEIAKKAGFDPDGSKFREAAELKYEDFTRVNSEEAEGLVTSYEKAQNKDAFIHELLVPNTRLAAGQYEAAAMRLDRVHQERLRLFAYLNAGFGASLEDLGAWTFVVNGGVGFDIPLLSFTRSAAEYSAEAAKERADSHLLDLETRTHFELKVLLDRLVTMKGQITGQEKRVQTAQELLAKRVVEVRKRLKERKVAVDAETDRILTALSKGETDELARLVPALVKVSADQRLEEKSWEALVGAANELVREETNLSAMIANRVKVQILVKRLATPDFRPIPSENALEQANEQFTRDAYQAQLKRVTNPYFRFLDENGGFLESAAKDLTAMEGVLSGFLPEMKKAADSAWAKHPEFKRMKKAGDVEKEGLIAEKKLALEERRVELAGKRKQLDAEKPGEKEDKKTQREWRKKLNELQKEQQKLDEELLELGKVESLIRTYKLFQDSQKKLQELVKAANGKSTEDQRHAMRDLLGGLVDGTESYLTSEYLLAKMFDLGAYASRDEWYRDIQQILEFIGDEGTSVFGYTGRIEAIQAAFVNVEKAWAVMKAELDIYVGVGYQRSIVQPETGEATTGSVFTLGFGGVFNHLKRAIFGARSGAQQTAAQLLAESSRAIIERARAHAQESKETWGIQSEMGKLTARIKLYEKIKEEFQQWRSSYEPRPDGVRTHVDRLRSLLVNDRATDEIYSLKTADLDARIQSDTAAIQYLESQLKRLGFSPDAIRQGTAYNEGLQTETTALAPIDEQLREMSRGSYSRQSATLNSMLDSVLARSTMGPSAYVTSASMAQSPFYRDAGVFYQSLDADAGLPGADSNRFAVFSWNGADLFGSQKQIYTLMLRHTRSLEDSAVKENERVIQSQVRSVVSAASRLRVLNRMNKLLSDQVSGLQKLEAMIGASRYEHGIKARSYEALETIALHESEDAFAANLSALWTEVKGMSVGEGEKKKIFHDRLATLMEVEKNRLAEDLDSLKTKAGQLGISFDLVEGLDLTKVGNLENYESDEAVRARVREEINEQFAKILDQNRLQFSVKPGLSHPSRQSELSKGEPFLGLGASYLIYDSNLQAMMNFWENRGSIEQLWAKQGDQDDKARWVELGLDVQKLQKEVKLRRDVVEAVATAYRIARERARRDGYPDAPIDAAFRYINELKAYKGAADAYWEASQRMIDFAREKGIKIELPRGAEDSIDRIKAMIPQWIEDDTTEDVTAPKYLEETVKPELTGMGTRAADFSVDEALMYKDMQLATAVASFLKTLGIDDLPAGATPSQIQDRRDLEMVMVNIFGRVAERYGRKDPAAWVARVTESYQSLQQSGFFEKTGFMKVGLGEEIWGNLFSQCFSMGPEAHKLLEDRGIDMNQLAIAAFMVVVSWRFPVRRGRFRKDSSSDRQ